MDFIIAIGLGWGVYCALMMAYILTEVFLGQQQDAE